MSNPCGSRIVDGQLLPTAAQLLVVVRASVCREAILYSKSGSGARIRTVNLAVNSRLLYR
jgi:hypothetical protein